MLGYVHPEYSIHGTDTLHFLITFLNKHCKVAKIKYGLPKQELSPFKAQM